MAGLALALFALAAPAAQAATITVNTTNDELNSDGDCSLREAIQASNTDTAVSGCAAGSGADTVDVPAGTYTISIAGDDYPNHNTRGDLDITADLTIDGAGADATIVDGADLDGVFHIAPNHCCGGEPRVTVEISGLTIRNGEVDFDVGGGINVNPQSTLILNDSVVSANMAADYGGGLAIGDPTANAVLTNVTVSGNVASLAGGGIYNIGQLELNNSTVSGNSGGSFWYGGGGILNPGSPSSATLNNSTVSGNTSASVGGGISNLRSSTLTLDNSTVSGNTASEGGGGIYNWVNSGFGSTATLNNSTVSGNRATGSGTQGGGGVWSNGTLTLGRSTLAGNIATASDGGAISNAGSASVDASTISGNRGVGGGGVWSASTLMLSGSTVSANTATNGGGLHNHGGTQTLTNATVSGNNATRGGGILDHDVAGGPSGGTTATSSTIAGNTVTSRGGGVYVVSDPLGSVSLRNTIVANNALNQNPSDCDGPIASQGHNLASDSTCSFTDPDLGDLQDIDPRLGPLQDNGGPTKTHHLFAGSPAIDAIPPSDCPSTDQRGVSRPQGEACDIGAFEGVDTDGDGVSDDREQQFGTDSNNPDTDGDGLNDGYELTDSCLDPLGDDAAADPDGDGLTNAEESSLGTDPCERDSDKDGCADDAELGSEPALGGERDPLSLWDFMDVPTGSSLARDRAVAGGDISAIVARFGANDATPGQFDRSSDPLSTPNAPISPSGARANYHPAYDRGGTIPGGEPWDLKPADGSIAGGDISATVAQFGHNCL
ncbi:MAG: choice-of-anchor Q domain-containing protein [Solirubrobacterales bacterium]